MTHLPLDRFWPKVARTGEDECWLWLASKTADGGYGRLTFQARSYTAHRFCWEAHNGPIEPGQHVLHRCDQPDCVNPAHLFLGTHAQNMRDKVEKGRASHGLAHGLKNALRFQAARDEAVQEIVTLEQAGAFDMQAAPDGQIQQADSDAHLVAMWLERSESPNTQRNYKRRAAELMQFVGRPLQYTRLGDVQAYLASLADKAPATRANATAAIKSLLSFAQEIGYIRFNVGKVVKAPSVKNVLAERILPEGDVIRMIEMEASPRNRAVLKVMYGGGLRISEACGLRWRDLSPRDDAGQVTVHGKGGKTRAVLLSARTWRELMAIRPADAQPDGAVFESRKGRKPLTVTMVHRVVKAAADRAGLPAEMSAHWLRHCHASHSLDRGAPIHLVQSTIGHASVATTGRYLHARPNDSSSKYLGV